MRTAPRVLLPAAALLAAVGLVLAGCQSSGSSTGSQSGGGGGNPSIAFTSPAADAQVASPVKVSFNVTGTDIGQPDTGKMHLHVYVDNSSQYKILYATQGSVDVPQGKHMLKAVLAQPNHTETSTTASEQVEVSGGGQQGTATTSGDGYGYP
jgi:hypothetical protein